MGVFTKLGLLKNRTKTSWVGSITSFQEHYFSLKEWSVVRFRQFRQAWAHCSIQIEETSPTGIRQSEEGRNFNKALTCTYLLNARLSDWWAAKHSPTWQFNSPLPALPETHCSLLSSMSFRPRSSKAPISKGRGSTTKTTLMEENDRAALPAPITREREGRAKGFYFPLRRQKEERLKRTTHTEKHTVWASTAAMNREFMLTRHLSAKEVWKTGLLHSNRRKEPELSLPHSKEGTVLSLESLTLHNTDPSSLWFISL